MSEEIQSCPSCGARVPAGSDSCDLCGRPIERPPSDAERPDDPGRGSGSEPASEAGAGGSASSGARNVEEEGTADCTECGAENPPNANYCSQCGTKLRSHSEDEDVGARSVKADLPGPSEGETGSDETDDESQAEPEEETAMTQQMLLVVGTAVGLVLVLFFVTQLSQTYEWGSDDAGSTEPQTTQDRSATTGSDGRSTSTQRGVTGGDRSADVRQGPSLSALVDKLGGPIDGPLSTEIDSLNALAGEAEGDRRRALQSELVRLYTGAGLPGQAALVQSKIAESTNSVSARRRYANLLYKWMRTVEADGQRSQISDIARHVAEAYADVVDQRPDDLDARTRMGEAYLLTNSPMKGIQAINGVLDDDSTFVPARFQKGLALLQIGRLDQAVRQFEKVMTFASESDPFYQQAQRAITVIRENASDGRSGAPSRPE